MRHTHYNIFLAETGVTEIREFEIVQGRSFGFSFRGGYRTEDALTLINCWNSITGNNNRVTKNFYWLSTVDGAY